MCPDEQSLSSKLPTAIAERTALARACRRDPALLAIAEGLTIYACTGDVDSSFRHPLTMARICDQGGEAAAAAYSNAVDRIQDSLKKGNHSED